ncbi:glycoside hydrolase family 3 protein [Klugiella xanthotipulae]|uniref:Beta-N-acetylhexosaminidase n=1 Tax=Klugiella xanthotipulae TaxID=244735 RepID=A0A543I515_9MICO|nr:beta-N-acetylhexosaminidase [Klugiella xanthotipulae]TQM65688.1 beta-N-acetylhexosaminidase [Klugiella xanthotipulae]
MIADAFSASADLARQISTTMLPGFEGHTLPGWLERRLCAGLGGVCLFSTNIGTPEQVRALTDAIRRANPRAVIAIDEEGGDVTRLHHATGSPFPGNAILGRLDDPELTRRVAARVGEELREVGCTLTFAPDADINSNPDNPVIGTRSFGPTADVVARHTAEWVRGVQEAGIAASAKHFPGHGDTAQDSHLALPVIDRSLDELRERELVPFRAAIAQGTRTIMTSHILLPQLDPERPATLSPTILQGLLREELGFTGVIVSDALDMRGASAVTGIPEAAVRALAAGCDLLCIGTANTDEEMTQIEARVATAVAEGRLEAARVAEAAGRVLSLAGMEPVATREVPGPAETLVSVARVAETFEVRAGVAVPALGEGSGTHLLVIDGVPNVAVGPLPWGPLAARDLGRAPGEAGQLPLLTEQRVSAGPVDAALAGIPSDRDLIVVGQNHHREPFNRELITALIERGQRVLTVDMGWPAPDRAFADIATFGASRTTGQALLDLLAAGRPATASLPGGAV